MTQSNVLAMRSSIAAVNKLWASYGMPELTETQVGIIDNILSGIKANVKTTGLSMSLEGPAGTGKTTLLLGLILAGVEERVNIMVSAFTHKACSVLAEKLDFFRLDYEQRGMYLPEPVTLHRLLNLTIKQPKFGEPQSYYQKTEPELWDLDFLIVDECSMVGVFLVEHIEDVRTKQGVNTLYAGDPHQLRPVNETAKSQTFNTVIKYALTKVLRHDGAILDLATATRKFKFIPNYVSKVTDDSIIRVVHDREELELDWLNMLKEAMVKGEESDVIMLCYKNANRFNYNLLARKLLYGEDTPRFVTGDLLIALSPYVQGTEVILSNNQDVPIYGEPQLNKGVTVLGFEDFVCDYWTLETDKATIHVIEEHHKAEFYKKVRALGKDIEAQQAKAKEFNIPAMIKTAKDRWRDEYFPLKNFFADVDFRYALTIHKSQGSTFKNVFVDPDYRLGRSEKVSLFYVAVTRASRQVTLLPRGYE